MTANEYQLTLEVADPLGADAMWLLREMRAEALSRYRDVVELSGVPPSNDSPEWVIYLIAWLDGRTSGCGALERMDEQTAEVRRVYVLPAARRQGIARRLVVKLEETARERGFGVIRLETGMRQPEAIALYESLGFKRIAPYGSHVGDPLSVCFEKIISQANQPYKSP